MENIGDLPASEEPSGSSGLSFGVVIQAFAQMKDFDTPMDGLLNLLQVVVQAFQNETDTIWNFHNTVRNKEELYNATIPLLDDTAASLEAVPSPVGQYMVPVLNMAKDLSTTIIQNPYIICDDFDEGIDSKDDIGLLNMESKVHDFLQSLKDKADNDDEFPFKPGNLVTQFLDGTADPDTNSWHQMIAAAEASEAAKICTFAFLGIMNRYMVPVFKQLQNVSKLLESLQAFVSANNMMNEVMESDHNHDESHQIEQSLENMQAVIHDAQNIGNETPAPYQDSNDAGMFNPFSEAHEVDLQENVDPVISYLYDEEDTHSEDDPYDGTYK